MRKLLVVFFLLFAGTVLWSPSAPARECDPAVSGGVCGGGQKIPAFDRSAVRDPVPAGRILVNVPTGGDSPGDTRSVPLEQTNNPASTPHARYSGILLAMGDEPSYRPERLNVGRAVSPLLPSRSELQMSRVDAGVPVDYAAGLAVQMRHSRFPREGDAASDGDHKPSPAASSSSPASRPGSGVLLIAGVLGICAVARRRISSMLG